MTRALSVVLVLSLGSCAFATKHPAVTVGIVAGSIGAATCFMAVEKPGTCVLVGLGAGVAMGGLTGLATTVFESNAPPEPDEDAEMMRRLRSEGVPEGPYLPPEPNPLPQTALPDAGVATADASAAPSPAAPPVPAGSASVGTPVSP
jgi:hypothetical protein